MNGLPEHEATRCKEYKAMADHGDANRPLPSDAKRGVSSIQVPGVTFEDESVPSTKSPVDIDVEDVQLHMLLSEANATGSEYMLKINEPFVSSISKPAPLILMIFKTPCQLSQSLYL
jgi:hypothetical protein